MIIDWRNMKLGTKLGISFGFILTLLILIGIITHIEVSRLWKYTNDLYVHPFQVNKATRDIKNDILSIESAMKSIGMDERMSREELIEKINDVDKYETHAYQAFDIVYKRYLGPKANIDSAYNAFKTWKTLRDEVIWLKQTGSIRLPYQKFKTENLAYREKLFSLIDVMVNFSSNKADEFYLNAQKGMKSIVTNLFLILIVAILTSVIVASLLIRSIKNPLKELTWVTKNYREGNYGLRSNYQSTNELGMLASAFNHLAASVQEDMIIKEEINKMAALLLSDNHLKPFCKNVLKAFITVTDSQIAAIYFLNEDKTHFVPCETIGVSENSIKSFSAEVAEGEFGSAIAQKKIVRITDIQEDTAYSFQTVAGPIRPKEIINIPILENEEVIAVISLASMHSFSSLSMQIINGAWFRLNANINRVLSYMKISEFSQKLDQQYHILEKQSKELEAHSEELTKYNIELKEAKERAESADKLKTAFLNTMSHELRTPLNSILGFTGILLHEIPGPLNEEQKRQMGMVQSGGRHLLSLINDILDLSKIEAGQLDAKYEIFEIQRVIEESMKMIRPVADNKKITLFFDKTEDFLFVESDKQRVFQVIMNVLSNAVKFTIEGSVRINCYRESNNVKIEIADTGIGIKKENLEDIFKHFIQIDNQLTRNNDGSGLGLSISKKLIELLHGEITVKSEFGVGSTFTISIPVKLESV